MVSHPLDVPGESLFGYLLSVSLHIPPLSLGRGQSLPAKRPLVTDLSGGRSSRRLRRCNKTSACGGSPAAAFLAAASSQLWMASGWQPVGEWVEWKLIALEWAAETTYILY